MVQYYLIGLGAAKHWESAGFTYASEHPLQAGDIVQVPFGNIKKYGVVLDATTKPTFKTKTIVKKIDVSIPARSIEFCKWYQQFYAASYGQVYTQVLPNYLKFKQPASIEIPKNKEIELTNKQYTIVKSATNGNRVNMLHGLTGSGKTRIYIALLASQLAQGKDGLLLYPEIGLTSQIYGEITKYLPVLYFHSQLTDKERSQLWSSYVSEERKPVVVIGTRSTLFLPHRNLGAVIIDEAHEQSYKQQNDIRYNSLLVAGGLAKIHKARFLAGSATPPITETQLLLKNGGKLLCLHEKPLETKDKRKIHIIDARNRDLFKRHGLFADSLLQTIEHNLANSLQTMLYINRRGTAKLQTCDNCGWQATCERCDLPLTYHHDTYKLLCHTCGYSAQPQSICPDCGSDTKLASFGSKAIVTEVEKLFPTARIARFDSDNKKSDSLAEKYTEVHSGQTDIIIGTQQIVKGLDLPKLATIGILSADLSLHFPDFTSEERTFQLVNQAVGRVGRGHTAGSVYLQTFQPDSPLLLRATTDDWHSLYEQELKNRQLHDFPPSVFAMKLVFRDKSEATAKNKAEKCLIYITSQVSAESVSVQGPIASFYAKQNGYFHIQLLLRSKSRNILVRIAQKVANQCIVDLDPATFL